MIGTRPSNPAPSKIYWALMLCAMLVGVWLRFDGLGHRALWLDESCTFYAEHHVLDWPTDGPDRVRELAHTPYVLLLHAWTNALGETPFGLRSFSAIMGCLTILVIALVTTRLAGARAGAIAAMLTAVHPLHVHYSQEARVYALWALESTILPYLLFRAARSLQMRWWLAYALLAWLLVLTHYYALLLLPATGVTVLLASDRRRCARQWLVTHVMLATSLVPLMVWVVWPHSRSGPATWLADIWHSFPPVLAVPRSLDVMVSAGGYPDYLGVLHTSAAVVESWFGPAGWWIVRWAPPFVVLALLVGLTRGGRSALPEPKPTPKSQSEARPTPRGPDADARVPRGTRNARPIHPLRMVESLIGLTVIFLFTAWIFSAFVRPAYVVGRYDMVVWPFVVMALALLIDTAASRLSVRLRIGALAWCAPIAVLVACSFTTTLAARSVTVTEDLPRRAERIAARVSPDDLLVSLDLYRWFMTYEWHRLGLRPDVISFPPRHDRQMCWDDPLAELDDPNAIARAVSLVTVTVEQALSQGRRVWLLAHGRPQGPRWEIDRRLFAALRTRAIDVRPVDEWVGLARLQRVTPAVENK